MQCYSTSEIEKKSKDFFEYVKDLPMFVFFFTSKNTLSFSVRRQIFFVKTKITEKSKMTGQKTALM